MKVKKNFRKRLLINKPYQTRFIAEVLAVILLATALSTGAAWFLTKGEVESGFFSGHRKLVNLREVLPRVLAASGLATLAAMAILGALVTLRETHRVIGPVRRLEKKFQEMAEGDFTYLEGFRRGDVLKGLDDSINIHLNNLSDFFRVFEMAMKEITPKLAALERGEGDAKQILAEVRKRLAEIDHYADAFRPN